MTSLPDGEVHLDEVMAWAQEQSQYMMSPSQTLVLWYLCINAFRHETNYEDRYPGDVLSGRVSLSKIQMGTGLSQRAVRYALDDLQDWGYICAVHKPGNGKSRITVYWTSDADEMRAEVRAGVRTIPVGFKRETQSPGPRPLAVLATVIPFPKVDS